MFVTLKRTSTHQYRRL